MQLRNGIFLLSYFVISFLSGITPAIAATSETVAWIESVKPKNALTTSSNQAEAQIIILRQGKPMTFGVPIRMTELKAGDRILIKDERAYLDLINSNGALRITAAMTRGDGYEINTKPSSIWSNLLAFVTEELTNTIKPGQAVAVSAATRGGCPQPDDINFPFIPADKTEMPRMAAGERALHFIWRCGKSPYRLSLIQDDKVIDEINLSSGFEVTLSKQLLRPGTYKLVLKDKKGFLPGVEPRYGNAYVTENLILVAPEDVPAMPDALVQSKLPEATRHLLYADWLSRQGSGEWAMEAIQHVIPYAKDYEPAIEWLRQWGGQ